MLLTLQNLFIRLWNTDWSSYCCVCLQHGFTPLYMAAQENHVEIVRILLASHARQDLQTDVRHY